MTDVSLKRTEPITVAYIGMKGTYDRIPEGYRRLYEWVEHYGLQPIGMPEAVFLTVPGVGPDEDAEWELWAPIAGGAGRTEAGEDRIGVKRVEPDTVAAAVHEGPYDEVGSVYDELAQWVGEHGYEVIGPPREVYHSGPETPAEKTVTEIQMPVAHRA